MLLSKQTNFSTKKFERKICYTYELATAQSAGAEEYTDCISTEG